MNSIKSDVGFYELTPDRVLKSLEAFGLEVTGRCLPLNSYENRVYDVELENRERKIVKFYRPAKWSREQILEEHEFAQACLDEEIPAVVPLKADGKSTLFSEPDTGIFFALFPKVGGRAPDELTAEQMTRIGMLLGRLHAVGGRKPFQFRRELTPTTYGRDSLRILENLISERFRARYIDAVIAICEQIEPWFASAKKIRVHGDCHLGNMLWNQQGPFFLDFDDCLMAPAVQDLWLALPGVPDRERDPLAFELLERLLAGYEVMRNFDRGELRLIEPLRSLRMVHYAAWIAKRWDDPSFKHTFSHFGSDKYWSDETLAIEEQLEKMRRF